MLKQRFKESMSQAKVILKSIDIEDEAKRIANVIDYFFDEEKRKEFIKLFKEIQEIYEIISPDEFLSDYIRDYQLLVQVHQIIYNTFNPEAERKRVHRDILAKTEKLIKESVELRSITDTLPIYEINKDIANLVKADKISDRVKIINLHRSLVIYIDKNKRSQPFLISIAEKIDEIINQLKERQRSVESTLNDLTKLAAEIAESGEEQRKSGLSKEEFSIFWILRSYKIDKPEDMAKRICKNIESYGEWLYNEKIERELRTELYKVLLESRKPVQSHIKDRDRIMEEAIYEPGHLKELVDNILKMHRVLVEGK